MNSILVILLRWIICLCILLMLLFRSIVRNIVEIMVENGPLKILSFIFRWFMELKRLLSVLNKLITWSLCHSKVFRVSSSMINIVSNSMDLTFLLMITANRGWYRSMRLLVCRLLPNEIRYWRWMCWNRYIR